MTSFTGGVSSLSPLPASLAGNILGIVDREILLNKHAGHCRRCKNSLRLSFNSTFLLPSYCLLGLCFTSRFPLLHHQPNAGHR